MRAKMDFVPHAETVKQTPWPGSTSELYRSSDHSFTAKLVPTFADWGSHVVIVADPYGRILGFLDWSHYFFFQKAPQLYSRGRVDPVPDPLLLRKSGSAGNRTRTSGSVVRNCDHETTEEVTETIVCVIFQTRSLPERDIYCCDLIKKLLWEPQILLCYGYRNLFSGGKAAGTWW
jgi:hypothetical protein